MEQQQQQQCHMTINTTRRQPDFYIPSFTGSHHQLPESPKVPMEFLSRSWSASALEVSKTLAATATAGNTYTKSISSSGSSNNSIPEESKAESEELPNFQRSNNQFSFTSSATSQLVLERIMSQSEVSPLTSGRLSHSSGPLNLGGSLDSSDSPPISPSEEFEDIVKYFRKHNTIQPLFSGAPRNSAGGNNGSTTPAGSKTVGRWLKDRREKKKEETRTQNAQLHAAISVAAVASAIAAVTAATAATSASEKKNEQSASKTDMAVASAATLVAAQCVEAAEAMGAERDHLASIVSSAVNVRSYDDIVTLTAAAATALRGAATLKARALKEVWNIAAVLPVEKGIGVCGKTGYNNNINRTGNQSFSEELAVGENFIGVCSQELLAKGSELLKRTRKGDLHWKMVSVYINKMGQVMLKMKSKHVGATITKKDKNVVIEVLKDLPAWPGRHLFDDGGEQRRYFGLKTETRRVVEFECRSQREYDIWTQGVSRLLSIVAERKNRR
ncbi:hypothetical protein ACFE04_012181 [Oxalis oulophora]